jgi:hypothetical protein
MNEQELRAKALELTIKLVSIFPESKRVEQLQLGDPSQVIIDLSQDFLNYLKNRN